MAKGKHIPEGENRKHKVFKAGGDWCGFGTEMRPLQLQSNKRERE